VIKPRRIKNSARLGRYFEEETASMQWCGKVAHFLQIKGCKVTRAELTKAASGYSPLDGRPLYQRRSSDRRLGWDIIFAPTKSVSVAAIVGSDGDRIIRAHFLSVESAFDLLAEPAAAIRTRSALGLHGWKTTGSMLFTHVVHRTNREKEPHLHSHVLVMNTTLTSQNTLMALETGPIFERFAAMERVYNHELCRYLRKDGIDAKMSENGKTIIPDLEGSQSVHSAFAKAHARVVTQATAIADRIQDQRSKDHLVPLHPATLRSLSRQIANDRYRPPKENGIEKKLTRVHWRHSINRACLELIDRSSKSRKKVRLRTVRNQNTQSVILPSVVAKQTSTEFPQRAKRNITAIQVMIRCTKEAPDLCAKEILEAALKYSAKIIDRSRREDMESHIKAGLALTGLRVLNTLEPTDKIKTSDPVLFQTLIDRVSPAIRRVRLAASIDKAADTYNGRSQPETSAALSIALTTHVNSIRTTSWPQALNYRSERGSPDR
jgi:conjugative relaxase-like TrwC/TraI family protein